MKGLTRKMGINYCPFQAEFTHSLGCFPTIMCRCEALVHPYKMRIWDQMVRRSTTRAEEKIDQLPIFQAVYVLMRLFSTYKVTMAASVLLEKLFKHPWTAQSSLPSGMLFHWRSNLC